MTAILDALAAMDLLSTAVVILLLMIVDTTAVVGLLLPSDALIITAAGAVGASAAPVVALAAIGGTLVGWTLSWWLGLRFGSTLRHGPIGIRVGESRWATAERLLGGNGRVLLVVQFLPVVNALIPFAAGTLRMPYRRFIAPAAVSTVAWAITYSLLGTLSSATGSALGTGPLGGLLLVGIPGMLAGSLVLARLRTRPAFR